MKKVVLIICALFFVVSGILAKEDVKPAKFENVTWHRVVLINYKPGKAARAKEIINIYQAAGAEAGTKGPVTYWFASGECDAMNSLEMEGGPSDMEWSRSTDIAKCRTAMIKQLGAEEAVNKLQEESQSLRLNTTSFISRKEI